MLIYIREEEEQRKDGLCGTLHKCAETESELGNYDW